MSVVTRVMSVLGCTCMGVIVVGNVRVLLCVWIGRLHILLSCVSIVSYVIRCPVLASTTSYVMILECLPIHWGVMGCC